MYDVILIGAGPGGYVAAIKAGQLGLKTLVIEKNELGGVCLHSGCIPTKALLSSAARLLEIKDAKSHGISVQGEIEADWAAMQVRKDKVVDRLTKGIAALFKQNKVEWKQAEAEVISPGEVRAGDERFQTRHLIIATGAHAVDPDLPGLDALKKSGAAVGPTELLFSKEIPKRLLIAGDNVFAVEYASLFAALGSEVTILAPSARLLPYMDQELSDFMKKELEWQKITLHTEAVLTGFEKNEALFEAGEKEQRSEFDTILLTLGSAPNTAGLEALNLTMNDKGFIKVNEHMQTSAKNVYAIGDVIGKYPLAHVASKEGVVAVENIAGTESVMRYDKLPMAVYSFPEVASVGLTEEKAREQFSDVKISRYPMTANGKALAEGDSKGFVKILSVPPYDEVIGMHIAGNRATDLIAEGVLALQLEATLFDLAAAVHAHPTPSEIIMEAADASI